MQIFRRHIQCEVRSVSNRIALRIERRPGFLLVTVLFCLLIAGLTLVSLSQRSIALTTEAAMRSDRLQRKWAIQSVQQSLLPRAGGLFAARDEQLAEADTALPYPSAMTASVVVGERPVQIILADEGARLNLNTVHSLGSTMTNQVLRKVCVSQLQAVIRLRPLESKPQTQQEKEDGAIPRVFGGWAQVFDLSAVQAGGGDLSALFNNITCWGPGRLNVRRVDRKTAIQFCAEMTSSSSARKILEAWWHDPRLSLPRVIESKGGLSDEEVAQMKQLLVDRSSSYSMTIACRSSHSTTIRFAVVETDDEGALRSIEFNY